MRALANALAFVGASIYKWQLPEEEAFLQRETGNPAATFRPRGELIYYSSDQNSGTSPRRGNGGADTFVLADASTEFYAASGESAAIKDFNPTQDSLQLKAGVSYAFTTVATDTSLFRGDASTGDLLAVLSGSNLGDGSFSSTAAAPTWAAFV